MLYSDTLQCMIISYTDIILLLSQKCHKIPHFMQNILYKTDYTKRIIPNRLMLAAQEQITASHCYAITYTLSYYQVHESPC